LGTGSLPGVKSGRVVTLIPSPLLAPWSRKGRAIPLLPLRALRPVQILSDCIRVKFTLPLYRLWISGVKRTACEINLSCQFSPEVKNEWRCTTTPSIRLHNMGHFTRFGRNLRFSQCCR